jgi:subtilisin family serine protease
VPTTQRERFSLTDTAFSNRTGRGVIVAVLDSGVHADHPHIGGVRGGTSFVPGEPTDFVDRIGHGTAVAAAIREKSPGVDLLAVRIFERHLSTNVDVLARAIAWASERGAQLINLSLGTANPANSDRLVDAIQNASACGSLVVSARESSGIAWLPGSLPGVVGVIADWECERDAIEVVTPATTAATASGKPLPVFCASAYPRPIPGLPRERNLSGVSFAVANVTGFLARALENSEAHPLETVRRCFSSIRP